jgi:glucose/arabinose dehydrogenase
MKQLAKQLATALVTFAVGATSATFAPAQVSTLSRLKLPDGFHVETLAAVPKARSLRLGDRGTIFVSTRDSDKLYALVQRDGRYETRIVASGLRSPNGIAFKDGTLYIAEISRISKIEHAEDNLDSPRAPVTVFNGFPHYEAHGWKFIGIGPDDKLYVPVGAPCNVCLPPEGTALISRINLDGSGYEVVARGVRNSVGFDWRPGTGQFYFTDNGRDLMGDNVPEDELNRVTTLGEHFGFPYCHQGTVQDPGFRQRRCGEFVKPVALLGPHAAALGMRFYTGTMFPKDYDGAIFIARHGSWNRTKKFGADVAVVKLNADGSVKSVEPFLTGFIQNESYLGRPVDVQVLGDGSLIVSDDLKGIIYRISYDGPAAAR